MTGFLIESWQVALFGLLAFVIVLVLIAKLWRDPTLRKIRVGMFIERERHPDDYRPWPKPPSGDEPTLHDWPEKREER